MGVTLDSNSGPVLDLSSRGLQKLEPSFLCSEDTHSLVLDRNHIMKLDYLERSPCLQQLSVACNRLVRMMGVSRLTELRILNLPNNSIGYIEGLKDLHHLEWLNLAGNNIKVMEQLNNCVSLQHLDLSDNNISVIGDLSKLLSLKTLLLHGNSITTLRTVSAHLPSQLSIISLAENEIRDLNEVSYLAPLQDLEQLSIMSNPCVMATSSLPGFDYRPYIMSWCLCLKILDGYLLSQKEALKAEWLYSQGKGRSYRPGQHVQLVQYLATVCPLTAFPALETAEDVRLEKILSKQRFHQRQLQQQVQGGSPTPPRPTQLDVETHGLRHVPGPSQDEVRETDQATAPETAFAPPSLQTEPTVHFNNWLGCDLTHQSAAIIRNPKGEEDLHLEDVQTDEYKLNGSLLSSESTFLPVRPDMEPNTDPFESEDETETFEPDSLAPEHPARLKKPSTNKTNPPPSNKEREKETVDEMAEINRTCASTLTVVKSNHHSSTFLPDTCLDCSMTELKVRQEEATMQPDRPSSCESESAVIRIQTWWRGLYTRRCHPVAKEVRSEIRLRRMQDHILFLSGQLERVKQQHEEERLQRLVQEEAVKFLWKQLQSMQQWQQSVEGHLANLTQAMAPAPTSAAGLCCPSLQLPVPCASSTTDPTGTEISFPDSGFQTTSERQAAQDDSFLSSGTGDSLETVRALTLGGFVEPLVGGRESADCSLLEEYLSSVQQREVEAEECMASDGAETPQLSSFSPTKMAEQPTSPPLVGSEKGVKDLEQQHIPKNSCSL